MEAPSSVVLPYLLLGSEVNAASRTYLLERGVTAIRMIALIFGFSRHCS
jgi:hypothetical protein